MRAFAIGLIVALFTAAPVAATTPHAPQLSLRTDLSNRDLRLVPPKAPAAKSAAAPVQGAAQVTTATPAFWVVHGPKGTAYLLGSIHRLPKNIDWETPVIKAAVNRADTFVFELTMDDEARAHMGELWAKNGLLPITDSLPSYFDEEMRNDYRDVIFLTRADPDGIVYLRPWFAAMVLQGAADSDGAKYYSEEGVDNKIYAEAVARHAKNFRAFETPEFQMKLLMGNGDIKDEVAQLRLTFKKIKKDHKDIASGLLQAWEKGDTRALAEYGPDSTAMTPEQNKAMLEDRNRRWIPQIMAMLNEKHTYFITVGAGHLVGKTGVPNLLRERGYTVDGPDVIASTSSDHLRASLR